MSQKIFLRDDEIPRQWYNIQADMPTPLRSPLGRDGKPIGPEDLAPVFPMNLIEQEISTERWIDIPEEVLDAYSLWRPSPLYRATEFERALGCPVKIYYKNEGVSPAGSHKPNTAVAQAYYNKAFGIKRLTTETGAGQWGCALAMACARFGLECKVFMVRISFEQKPFRRLMMGVWGGNCVPSPSQETQAGRNVLARAPDTPGSLGIAISEAIEQAIEDPNTRYALGSVLNHVMLHQTVIGLEARKQMERVNAYPDIIIGCAGGGSNFAGLAFPFVLDKIHGKEIDFIPAEPKACPTLTRAPFAYDHGDEAGMTPLMPMHSLGHKFIPAPIHAGGLRYHGMAPLVSRLAMDGLLRPQSYHQRECYEAGILWARTEGFIPAPETSHAIAAVVAEARKAKEEGKEKTILFNWSGHGLLDLIGYDRFMRGELQDVELSEEELRDCVRCMDSHPRP
ncbi:MAG: TrpB-like pyridoxal phosphate-dependent enzyme [Candidatus Omnitrophica bacterium]|nr:TrpB-like pyridoxal phosphate-dependent enzyme [Candidatus Omnitrophota bacterium]